jgi:hypothetical protein
MGILRRIEYMTDHSFPWRKMDFKILQRVYRVVHEYQFEHVKHVSLAAAAIYKWVCTSRHTSTTRGMNPLMKL